jgi:hypothetical protein
MRLLLSVLTAAVLGITAWVVGLTPADPGSAGRVTVDGDVDHDRLAAYKVGLLTPSGFDTYDVRSASGATMVAAPGANTGENLRVVLWRPSDAESVDQHSCATIHAEDHDQQPGVALRIRTAQGRTQAVTVTKNVWLGMHAVFNVHVMDSGATVPFHQVGAVDLTRALLGAQGRAVPYPWRLCARAQGDTVEVLAWPAGESAPAWGDPDHGGQVPLPPGWRASGYPGLYVGHLPAGHTVGFSEVTGRTATIVP